MKINRNRILSFCFIFVSLFFLLTACEAADTPAEAREPLLVGFSNPAAEYCMSLGYEYSLGDAGGVCNFPDDTSCDEWDFLSGKCGNEFSHCALNGWETITKTDGQNTFTDEYAVCVDPQAGEIGAVSALANLSELATSECEQQVVPFDDTASAPKTYSPEASGTIPTSFDWRNQPKGNYVTGVRNQGGCGSCWAFATVAVTESSLNIAYDTVGDNYDLSEQYLVSDCHNGGSCCGGYQNYALYYVYAAGIPDESCMSYVDGTGCSCDSTCSSCTYNSGAGACNPETLVCGSCSDRTCGNRCADYASRLVYLDDWDYVATDTTSIKTAVVNEGPLSAYMTMSGYFDGNGIYNCSVINTNNGHAITIVGYNDTGQYYIVKNSWGASWNGDGYFKVGYGECMINENVLYASVILLSAPTLSTPSNGSNTYDRTPTFDWSDVDSATSYDLEYSTSSDFSGSTTVNVASSTYTPASSLSLGTYYWRVKAKNSYQDGQWSSTWSVTIEQDVFWLREFGYGEGWENPETPRTVGDVNGDGISDLIGFAPEGVRVALGEGGYFADSTLWLAAFGSNPAAGGWGGDNTIRTVADVNGDGKDDIVGFGNYGVLVSLSTGTTFLAPEYWIFGFGSDASAGGWSSTDNNRVLADVNGDGMADVVGYADYGVLVGLSTGTGFQTEQYWIYGYGRILGEWDGIQNPRTIADINGDGCGDVVGFGNYGIVASLSNACNASPVYNFGAPNYWAFGYAYMLGGWDSTRHIRTFSDVDGDGDADMIGFGDFGVVVSVSNGVNTFGTASYWMMGYGYISGGWDVDQHPRSVADVTGDGKGDVIGYATDGVLVEVSDGSKFGQ